MDKDKFLLLLLVFGLLAFMFLLIGEVLAADLQEIYFPVILREQGTPTRTPRPTPTLASTPTPRLTPTPAPTMCISDWIGGCTQTPTPYIVCLPNPCRP